MEFEWEEQPMQANINILTLFIFIVTELFEWSQE